MRRVGRRRRWPRLILVVGIVAVAAVGYAIATLRVEEIRVIGTRALGPTEVVTTSGLRGGERILWMRTSVVGRRLAQHPGIASASVERLLPTTIVLRVVERQPAARLAGRSSLVVDTEGFVFPAPADPERLPVLGGWEGTVEAGGTLDERSRSVLRALEEFPTSIRRATRRIEVSSEITFVLAGGTEVRFGRPSDLVEKASAAVAVLEATEGRDLAYVDVRSPEVPTTRRRGARPTPPATEEPGGDSEAPEGDAEAPERR